MNNSKYIMLLLLIINSKLIVTIYKIYKVYPSMILF